MTNEEIEKLLSHLKELVARDDFYAVYRRGDKFPLRNSAIKKIVPLLKVSEFKKRKLDHNGSGDFIFVFITRRGRRIYIKFKFVFKGGREKVKFISFHFALLHNARINGGKQWKQ